MIINIYEIPSHSLGDDLPDLGLSRTHETDEHRLVFITSPVVFAYRHEGGMNYLGGYPRRISQRKAPTIVRATMPLPRPPRRTAHTSLLSAEADTACLV